MCVLGGMCIWDTIMAELGMEISNNDSWLMGIKSRKIWDKFYRIYMFGLIVLAFENLGPLIILRSIYRLIVVTKNI